MKQMLTRYRTFIATLIIAVSLLIAVLYALVIPNEAENYHGITKFVISYSHSLVWLLLAAAALSWAVRAKRMYIVTFAYMALVVYALFLLLLIV